VYRIAVGGSSAGACLAAGLTLRARDAGGPRICFQALLFPVLDDRPSTWSPGTRIWDEANATGCWSLYLGPRHDDDAVSMYIAPGRTDHLSGLPSAYVLSAEFDVVRCLNQKINVSRDQIVRTPRRDHVVYDPQGLSGADVIEGDAQDGNGRRSREWKTLLESIHFCFCCYVSDQQFTAT